MKRLGWKESLRVMVGAAIVAVSILPLSVRVAAGSVLTAPVQSSGPSAPDVPPVVAGMPHAGNPPVPMTIQAPGVAVKPSPSAETSASPTSSAAATPSWSPLTAQTLSGGNVDLLKQPGWRVIYFWSAECPCVRACENFSLRPLASKYAGKVRFYAVVSGAYDLNKPLSELSQDIAAHKLSFPVLLDPKHTVAKTLNAEVTPECYLLDPQNRILYSGMPDDSKRFLLETGDYGITKSFLAVAMTQALAGKKVTMPRTQNEGCSIAW